MYLSFTTTQQHIQNTFATRTPTRKILHSTHSTYVFLHFFSSPRTMHVCHAKLLYDERRLNAARIRELYAILDDDPAKTSYTCFNA
jgi:hypothetical protein